VIASTSARFLVLSLNETLKIINGSNSLEEADHFLGLFKVMNLIINHQWEFWDILNLVATGIDQWNNS